MAATGYVGGDPTKISRAGDTMVGPLLLPGDPTAPLDAADKAYVDAHGGAVASVNGHTGLVVLGAADVAAVALTGDETVAGVKTFTTAPLVPAGSFPQAAVVSLPADLAARTVYRGVWAASTAYAVNDLVTVGGELAVCSGAHTSTSVFALTHWVCLTSPLGRFNVRLYGAQGDGVTDDTAAIRAAADAAAAWALSSSTMVVDVYYPPGTYLLAGAPVQGGPTLGNAQIPLPVVGDTGQSMVVRHHGPAAGVKPLHWLQSTAQTAGGAVLQSTSAAGYDATYGQASVIGGPTPEQGYGRAAGLFSNILVEISDLSVVVPNNPAISGVDLLGCAGYRVGTLSVKPDAPPGSIALPTTSTQFGVRCADNDNNDSASIDDLTVYGCNYALITTEHLVMRRLTAVYNVAAIEVGRGGDTSHGARLEYASVENCNVGVGVALGSFPAKLDIGLLDWENSGGGWWNTFAVVNDPTGAILGTIGVTTIGVGTHLGYSTSGDAYVVRGPAAGTNVRVYDMTRQSGNAGAVSVPASGVATVNPLFRDAMVVVGGGTVSGIKVDGQDVGITAGTIIVPTCRPLTLTYTVAPTTYAWTLL